MKPPWDHSRETYLLISEHMQEGQRPLGDSSRNQGAGRCHFPSSAPQPQHTAAFWNQGADLHPPTCRHPTPLSLHCSRPSPSSQACLSPGAAGPRPQKTARTLPTLPVLSPHTWPIRPLRSGQPGSRWLQAPSCRALAHKPR